MHISHIYLKKDNLDMLSKYTILMKKVWNDPPIHTVSYNNHENSSHFQPIEVRSTS